MLLADKRHSCQPNSLTYSVELPNMRTRTSVILGLLVLLCLSPRIAEACSPLFLSQVTVECNGGECLRFYSSGHPFGSAAQFEILEVDRGGRVQLLLDALKARESGLKNANGVYVIQFGARTCFFHDAALDCPDSEKPDVKKSDQSIEALLMNEKSDLAAEARRDATEQRQRNIMLLALPFLLTFAFPALVIMRSGSRHDAAMARTIFTLLAAALLVVSLVTASMLSNNSCPRGEYNDTFLVPFSIGVSIILLRFIPVKDITH